ncbi:MAG: cysteine hydrolase [Phycisphaerales bacterium]
MSDLDLEPSRCAVLVVDLQNDNLAAGGASDGTEAFQHAIEQNVVENAGKISEAARQAGAQVVHCHFVVEPEADYSGRNIKLFRQIAENEMVVRGKWGAQPVDGAEPKDGDLVLERARMSSFHGTQLDIWLRNLGIDTVIVTGVHTCHAVNGTARAAADHGYRVVLASDATASMSAEWQEMDLRTGLTNIAEIADTASITNALTGTS